MERIRKMKDATIDFVQPGEMQPERDHNFKAHENNMAGPVFGLRTINR